LENLVYRAELAWGQLASDIGAPALVGIAGGVIVFFALLADIRNRNRRARVMKTQWHCVDPRNSLDQES